MADLTKGIKNIVLGGIGAAAITAEKAGEAAEILVEKGAKTVEQGKAANEELKRNVQEKLKNVKFPSKAAVSVDDIAEMIAKLSPEEKEELKAKIAEKETVCEETTEETKETEEVQE